MIIIGVLGLQAAKVANTGLDTVYKDRVVPLKGLKIIADLYAVNIVDTAHKVRNGNMAWDEGRKSANDATKGIMFSITILLAGLLLGLSFGRMIVVGIP